MIEQVDLDKVIIYYWGDTTSNSCNNFMNAFYMLDQPVLGS